MYMVEGKVVSVNSYVRKQRDPKEMKMTARKAIAKRWKDYYARKRGEEMNE